MAETPFVKTEAGLYCLSVPVTEDVVIDQAKQILSEKLQTTGISFISASLAMDYVYCELAKEEREVFACAWLTSQHQLICFEKLFYGSINQAPVFPRELVKRALQLNASAVLLCHNHPSGVNVPSAADKCITELVKTALDLVDCRVLDHLIVGAASVYSFAEHGEL